MNNNEQNKSSFLAVAFIAGGSLILFSIGSRYLGLKPYFDLFYVYFWDLILPLAIALFLIARGVQMLQNKKSSSL
jgi:hypothetical protein